MKKLAIATAIGAVLVSSSVFADVTAQSGVYIGGLGGWSFAPSPSANQAIGVSKTNKNFTLGASLGYGYAIDQNFLLSAEASYISFGKNEYTSNDSYDEFTENSNETIKNLGLQFMLAGTYLMNNGFNTFVKLGAIHEKTQDSFSDSISLNGTKIYSTSTTNSISKWVPAAAFGIGYMPVQNLNIALQYEHVFGADWNQDVLPSKPMTQNAVTLGLNYTFAM